MSKWEKNLYRLDATEESINFHKKTLTRFTMQNSLICREYRPFVRKMIKHTKSKRNPPKWSLNKIWTRFYEGSKHQNRLVEG